MRARLRGALVAGVAAALVCSALAFADNYPVRDGTGALQTFASKLIGGVTYPQNIMTGMFGATPTPLATDASGNVGVNIQNTLNLTPNWSASGLAPVTGSATATGQSSTFTPNAGRPANLAFSGTGTFTLRLERQFSGDLTWYPVNNGTTQKYTWSTNGTATVTISDVFTESETGVGLRWNVTACTSCSLTYRISQ